MSCDNYFCRGLYLQMLTCLCLGSLLNEYYIYWDYLTCTLSKDFFYSTTKQYSALIELRIEIHKDVSGKMQEILQGCICKVRNSNLSHLFCERETADVEVITQFTNQNNSIMQVTNSYNPSVETENSHLHVNWFGKRYNECQGKQRK